jgi:benzoylformate decarboxylase
VRSKATRNSVTVRQAVIDLLRGFGMTTVFGNPGSTELPFLADWPEDFRYILGLQEASVVAMADGYARTTGRAAFCNLHSAAGVGHALGNIFTAYRNQAPLVISAGQQARSLLPMQPFLGATDAASFPKPYVKWSCEPARAEDVPAAIAHAYYIAMQRPCGPTFVSIPSDDWTMRTQPLLTRAVSSDVAPDPALIAQLASVIKNAKRPALVIGPEVDQENAGDAAIELAEQVRAAVWTSPFSSRVSFPEEHRLFAGFLPAAPQAVSSLLAPYDLIVVVGAPMFTFHVAGECPLFDDGERLFQITADADAAASAKAGASIVGSLRLALESLLEQAVPTTRKVPVGRKRPASPPASDPIKAEYLMHVLAKTRPSDAIVVEEAPSHRPAMQEHLPMQSYGSFYTMASGGLGYALPAAVGIGLAKAGRPIVCLIGDGSFMYSCQAIWNAVQERLPLTIVVINNSGYGAMRSFSHVLGVKGAPGIDVAGIDYVQVAGGFGCMGQRVSKAADLAPALAHAFAQRAPFLIEVIVDQAIPTLYAKD